jgi:ribosomal protein S21
MKTVVEVTRNSSTEPALSVIRRFTRRVKGSGVLQKVRGNRYFTRKSSDYKQKARALKTIERRAEYERLKKLGKV